VYTNGLNKWAVETMGYKLSGYGLRSIGRGIEVYRRSIGINFIYFFLIFSDTLPIRYRRSIGVSKYQIRIGIRVRQVSEVSVQPRSPLRRTMVRPLQRKGEETEGKGRGCGGSPLSLDGVE